MRAPPFFFSDSRFRPRAATDEIRSPSNKSETPKSGASLISICPHHRGVNFALSSLAQREAKCTVSHAVRRPDCKSQEGGRGKKNQKKNLATGGAKPSAPFPLSTSSPPLPYSAMCHLQVVWERDLVTFECPIKRRGSVRAPLRVPFRHVTDEQAAIFPVNRTHSHANTFLPPPDSFSCLLPPSVLPVFFAQTLSPPR